MIGIASDHAGYKMKQKIVEYLKNNDYSVKDFGTNSEISVDYADYAHP
ncbi:MAG: RpiB/LacA/LacB family sugar-phosphate isomerase, partial [Bacteroidota bacterium]|nr:RpiB/LacA/LacB family sugar-phosphate isomerase [Bacteroidota bacterium]